MLDLLNMSSMTAIKIIDTHYHNGVYAINKRESEDKVWQEWGNFCLTAKMNLEKTLVSAALKEVKWLYAYVQNRNRLISLKLKSRLSGGNEKKKLAGSCKLLRLLLDKKLSPKLPCKICEAVEAHVLRLSTGQADIICDRPFFVKDYPEEYRYTEPSVILTPKTRGTLP